MPVDDDELLDPAPPWRSKSDFVWLWHGCGGKAADSILGVGVSLDFSRPCLDFGRGFYTTTSRKQADFWAWECERRKNKKIDRDPVVVGFKIKRERLANLCSLAFVDGSSDNEDYWSFVQHCRLSDRAPHRYHAEDALPPYDVVFGPVAGQWRQRIHMPQCDQVAFHTDAAVYVLNEAVTLNHTVREDVK